MLRYNKDNGRGIDMSSFSANVIDRVNSDSVKWRAMKTIYKKDDLLPMWVADMDFLSPQEIIDALKKRAEHGIFGYPTTSKKLYTSITNWLEKRFQWTVNDSWILLGSGVVSSLAFAIRALTNEGDKILIQSPVYAPFFQIIENNERQVVNSELVYKNGSYMIDFDDFEKKLKQGVKLLILCNPHNPVGRVWTKEELTKIGELCEKYQVYILSDEIHCDLVYKPNKHVPIASLNQRWKKISITFMAPSKTFNIPGLQASFMVIPDHIIREKIKREMEKIGFHGPNIFGMIGMMTAYEYGEEWLSELLPYLKENIDLTVQYIQSEIPQIKPVIPEGTYLLWLNCREFNLSDEELKNILIEKGKIVLEPGTKYGRGGEGFVRMNIACPRPTLEEGWHRLKQAFS